MLKKIFAFTLMCVIWLPFTAFAQIVTSGPYYDAGLNEYIVNYDTSTISYSSTTFTGASGTIWGPYFYKEDVNPQSMHFTCNGHYQFDFYDSSGTKVDSISFDTTEIINPP